MIIVTSVWAYRASLVVVALASLLAARFGTLALRRHRLESQPTAANETPIAVSLNALYGSPERLKALYDSSTIYFEGPLSQPLPHAVGADSVLVLLVHATDCFTCEDLGRQLRELQHVAGQSYAFIVYTTENEAPDVAVFLSKERIRVTATMSGSPSTAFGRELLIGTPAMAVVDSRGVAVRGVSHSRRMPNVRPKSFAQELGFTPDQ
jgi:hypothetical protein